MLDRAFVTATWQLGLHPRNNSHWPLSTHTN